MVNFYCGFCGERLKMLPGAIAQCPSCNEGYSTLQLREQYAEMNNTKPNNHKNALADFFTKAASMDRFYKILELWNQQDSEIINKNSELETEIKNQEYIERMYGSGSKDIMKRV